MAAGLAGIDEKLVPTEPIEGSAYDRAHDLPSSFAAAHERMTRSESAPRLLGAALAQAYLSVKGLEYDSFQREISAWERRFLVTLA